MLEADTGLQTALPMSDVALIPKNTDHHYVSQNALLKLSRFLRLAAVLNSQLGLRRSNSQLGRPNSQLGPTAPELAIGPADWAAPSCTRGRSNSQLNSMLTWRGDGFDGLGQRLGENTSQDSNSLKALRKRCWKRTRGYKQRSQCPMLP